jgi:putative endonuclease
VFWPKRKQATSEDASRILGRRGEQAAARFLQKLGYRILLRNFACPAGEIDIIALDRGQIVFAEVKTRRSSTAADPEIAVHKHKRRQNTQAARYFLTQTRRQDAACRFDVLAIVLPDRGQPQIEHFINAFEPTRQA